MARRITLDRDYLIQMAIADDFYATVPAFQYLQDVAKATWVNLQKKKGCIKCFHEWDAMRGVCDAIFLKLRQLKEAGHPALQDVKRWLSKRKGYAVGVCVLYYRRSRTQGKIAKFEF